MSTVKTDKLDYQPGSTVFVTASDFTSGAAIEFQVLNLGADGVQGTADDFLYKPWAVTDGLNGDSNSEWGTIGTTWGLRAASLVSQAKESKSWQ
jgi:hypothetical protein